MAVTEQGNEQLFRYLNNDFRNDMAQELQVLHEFVKAVSFLVRDTRNFEDNVAPYSCFAQP